MPLSLVEIRRSLGFRKPENQPLISSSLPALIGGTSIWGFQDPFMVSIFSANTERQTLKGSRRSVGSPIAKKRVFPRLPGG